MTSHSRYMARTIGRLIQPGKRGQGARLPFVVFRIIASIDGGEVLERRACGVEKGEADMPGPILSAATKANLGAALGIILAELDLPAIATDHLFADLDLPGNAFTLHEITAEQRGTGVVVVIEPRREE